MCNVLRGLGGTMTIQGAFNNSLNVGTITAIRKLGNGSQINLPARQILYEYYHDKFGFGAKTGIELGEASGYIYPARFFMGDVGSFAYGANLGIKLTDANETRCFFRDIGVIFQQ
jgi:cell division protein FtsI/penicillin-binding protein 2